MTEIISSDVRYLKCEKVKGKIFSILHICICNFDNDKFFNDSNVLLLSYSIVHSIPSYA